MFRRSSKEKRMINMEGNSSQSQSNGPIENKSTKPTLLNMSQSDKGSKIDLISNSSQASSYKSGIFTDEMAKRETDYHQVLF